MELSYTELRCKEIVNTQSGEKMGKPIDIIFDSVRGVLGLVAPGERKLFKAAEDIFIPWKSITKIGSDVILVSLNVETASSVARAEKPSQKDICDDCADNFL